VAGQVENDKLVARYGGAGLRGCGPGPGVPCRVYIEVPLVGPGTGAATEAPLSRGMMPPFGGFPETP